MINQNLYLFHLTHDFLEFRYPELQVISEAISKPNCITNHNYCNESPLFTCNLPNDDTAQEIANRSFLLKSISKIISVGDDFDELIKRIESVNHSLDLAQAETFKIDVYSYGKIYTQEQKLEKIEKLVDALRLEEKQLKVCLNEKMVKHKFFYAEEWIQSDYNSNFDFDQNLSKDYAEKNSENKFLRKCYLGKFICNGQNNIVHKYNLKDRSFIGNTSMDPLLSLIMANMAKVTPKTYVYDPFVGTGSLLVGAAHCGGFVAGADLDYNLVHSRGLSSRMGQKYRKKDETIRNNLKQYGLENKYIDILAADFSTKYIRDDFLFDAIITDPPYGIREKAKKLEDDKVGFVQHTKYNLGDIYYDLMEFASKHLVDEGRLVFWLPIYVEEDRNKLSNQEMRRILMKFIPSHQDLILTYFSEQRLTKFTSRLLITMIKGKKIDDLRKNIDQLELNNDTNEIDSNGSNLYNKNTDLLNQFRDKYFATKK